MKNIVSILLVTLLCGCFATTDKRLADKAGSIAVPDSVSSHPGLSKADIDKYYKVSESFYDVCLKPSGFNGAMIVAKNGEIVFERYAGRKRLGQQEEIDANTPFHLASVSKTFTGMATLKLWEEGKLDINQDVSTYLPGFNYPGVTVKTLLNHRSGLPNYVHVMEEKGWDRKIMATNQDVLNFLINRKQDLMVGRPDRNFSYCNTNYALLALIVEKVSGKSFPTYLQETFFKPLGMDHSFVFQPGMEDSVLPSYNWRGRQEAFTFLDQVYGDKNVYSTPRDMLKWANGLTYGQLFRQETLDAAYTGYSNEKPGVKNYGLGWRLYLYPDHRKIIYHNGWWHGNNTVFTRLVDDGATVIILGNKFNRRIYDAKKLYTAFGKYDAQVGED